MGEGLISKWDIGAYWVLTVDKYVIKLKDILVWDWLESNRVEHLVEGGAG